MKKICLILLNSALTLLIPILALAKPGDLVIFSDRPTVTAAEIEKTLPRFCPGTKSKINASIQYISFTYDTLTVDGKLIQASAALLVPRTSAPDFPLVSYQHGTTVERRLAPSNGVLGSEGRGVGTCYASQGSIVVIPDYLGYGSSSNTYHPYLHADSEASVSADAIQAAKTLANQLKHKLRDQLFLAGYSQGGHSTVALHRFLEARKIRVTAVAPMAGPYDLSGTVLEAIKTPDPSSSTEAAFLVHAYNSVYSIYPQLSVAIRPQYTKEIAEVLPGDKSFLDVMALFPANPVDLLQPEFLKELLTDPKSRFTEALRQNDLLNWTPIAPLMLIHGTSDIQVPISNTVKAEEAFRDRGADVRTVWIGGKDHEDAAPAAFSESIKWFNTFL